MKKKDIISHISKNTGVEQVAVDAVIASFMDLVKQTLAQHEDVVLRGFGTFLVKKRAQRMGRNIQKNKMILVPAKKIAFFRPSKEFDVLLQNEKIITK